MKNLKSILVNGGLILLAVLMFVFMSQAYITMSVYGFSTSGSGFDMIDFSLDGKYDVLAISNVFVCIFVGLLAVAAIINLLLDFGVIKSAKFAKVAKITTLVLAVLTAVVALLSMIMLIVIIAQDFEGIGKLGWAVILNLVLAVVAVVIAIINKLSTKKN